MLTIVKLVAISLVQVPSEADDLINLFLLDLYHLKLKQIVQEPRFSISVLHHLLTNETFGKSFDYKQVDVALHFCARFGRLDLMNMLFEYEPLFGWKDPQCDSSVFREAVTQGDLKVMEWLWGNHRQLCIINDINAWVMERVVTKGDVETFRFLQERDLVVAAHLTEFSLGRCRQLEIVQFFLDKSAKFKPQKIAVQAARDGNHALLQFMWHKELIRCVQCVLEAALKVGKMSIVRWLENLTTSDLPLNCCGEEHALQQEKLKRACFTDRDCFLFSVMCNGRLDGLKWVLNRFPSMKVNGNMLIWSSMARDQEMLQWVLDQLSETGGCEEWMYGVALDRASYDQDRSLWRILVDRGCSLRGLEQALGKEVPELVQYCIDYGGVERMLISFADAAFQNCDEKLQQEAKNLLESVHGYNVENLIAKAAACRNGVGILKWCYIKDQPVTIQWEALKKAISWDRIDLTKYLMQQVSEETLALFRDPYQAGCFWKEVVSKAARTRDCSMLKGLVDFVATTLTKAAIDQAVEAGLTDLLEFMHEHRLDGFTARSMDQAAKYGHLNAVRFLHEHREEGCTTDAMDDAAEGGHLQVVQFLHEHRHEGCTQRAMNRAAANGFLKVVHYLHEHRDEGCGRNAMDNAAKHGYLGVIEFLHEHRCEGCSTVAMNSAAANGFLNVVKFLHENRPEVKCADDAICLSGSNGHVRIVKYLHEHGYKCKWSSMSFLWGTWRVVQYLWQFEDAKPHAQKALESACYQGQWDVVQWLIANVEQELDYERALVETRKHEMFLRPRERYKVQPLISCLEMQLQRCQTSKRVKK